MSRSPAAHVEARPPVKWCSVLTVTGCSGRGIAAATGAAVPRGGRLGRDPSRPPRDTSRPVGTVRVVAAGGALPQGPAPRAFRRAGLLYPGAGPPPALPPGEGVRRRPGGGRRRGPAPPRRAAPARAPLEA